MIMMEDEQGGDYETRNPSTQHLRKEEFVHANERWQNRENTQSSQEVNLIQLLQTLKGAAFYALFHVNVFRNKYFLKTLLYAINIK